VLQWLLRLYPRRFHDRYADDMKESFLARRDEARRSGGIPALARVWLRTTLSLLATAAAERWRSSLDPPARRPPARVFRPGGLVNNVSEDARFALRLMRRQPGYALFVAATLAVGIATVTAVFSVVNGVLLRPLPYAQPDELVGVRTYFHPESGFDFPDFPMSPPEYLDYRNASKALAGIAAFTSGSVTLGGPEGEPERVSGAAVTANLFDVLRVSPIAGRTFKVEEDRPHASPVVILSYGLWQSRFGGDPAVVGRAVLVNGTSTTVVGVMPATFAYPSRSTRIWRPLAIDETAPGSRGAHFLNGIGRLSAGTTVETARAELNSLMATWRAADADQYTGHGIQIQPLFEDTVGGVRRALLLLLGATTILLLIVCANVASVVLARGESRIRELAIRDALGAGRWRLVRLALVESAILAVVGGGTGLALAWFGMPLLLALNAGSLPRATEVVIDGRVLVAAAVTSIVSAMGFGLMPALKGSAPDLRAALGAEGRTATVGAGRLWARRGLVTAEVALAFVLVVGAGLMLRSLGRLLDVDPGFQPESVLLASISLPASAYGDAAQVEQFYAELASRIGAAPGVRTVSASTAVPIHSSSGVWDFDIEGRSEPPPGQPAWNAAIVVARPGFLETIGARLLRGRTIESRDEATAPPVVVINETLATKFFAGEDPIGRRLRVSSRRSPLPWMTIVGVIADMHNLALDEAPQPMYIVPHAQAPVSADWVARALTLAVRTDGPPDGVVAAIRAAVRELDPDLPVSGVRTYETVIADSLARPRFVTVLLESFAFIGLVLGASGIYGVLAYSVARRTHEIGIRRALGAQTRELMMQIVGQGMVPVGVGLAIGVVAALVATRLMRSLLFGVTPADLTTYATVVLGTLAVALAACLLPALRALRVSPLVALRRD